LTKALSWQLRLSFDYSEAINCFKYICFILLSDQYLIQSILPWHADTDINLRIHWYIVFENQSIVPCLLIYSAKIALVDSVSRITWTYSHYILVSCFYLDEQGIILTDFDLRDSDTNVDLLFLKINRVCHAYLSTLQKLHS
jgi:hypothetical protein